MRFLLSIGLLAALALPSSAQPARVKSGYEVAGPACWVMLDNRRVRPVSCWTMRRILEARRNNGE